MMNYPKQLQQAVDYIGLHLDEPLSLDHLSKVSCLSKFHFHRLFSAFIGMSLHQYVRWLRLKRAAHQLIIHKDLPILTIALDAGFESHEAFSRAFKQACGISPSQFRHESDWSAWDQRPYHLPTKGDTSMNVEIREVDKIRLAAIEHRGVPAGVGGSVNRLVTWAKAQPINLKPKPGNAFGIAYDDPEKTPPEEFRFDLAIRVPENFQLSGEVVEKHIPAGRYAVVMHKGSHDKLSETIYPLYRDWLPQSGEELGDFPCLFCYHNFNHEVADTELLTEVWVLLK